MTLLGILTITIKFHKKNENIEVRQIRNGIPHFFLTRTDQYAIIVLYLSSETWGAGPLWKCVKEFKLYKIVEDEFSTLWNLNEHFPKENP